ncbi:MAG: hypothetical protein IPK26_05935 [Planctomycetes bacterium]|nr:hypothetical protein [Planctomycetota bacterium]
MSFRLTVAAAFSAALAAQQPFPQNKLEFGNWWLQPTPIAFPNFLSTGGNQTGDALFKVFPAEVLERVGDHRLSGFKITFEVDPAFVITAGAFVRIEAVQFYRTMLRGPAGAQFESIDLTQPVGPQYGPYFLQVATSGPWEFEVRFHPTQGPFSQRQLLVMPSQVAGRRTGIAMLVRARVGERSQPSTAGMMLTGSFQERHLAPGQPSYSGTVFGATGTVAHFGEVGQPSATAELALGLRFADPVLQLRGSSAGGLTPDPQNFETYLGPGAYATDLGSRGGWLGFYVQDQAHFQVGQMPTHRALPFVTAVNLAGPTTSLAIGSTVVRIDPSAAGLLSLWLDLGQFGLLQTLVAGSAAGFSVDQNGVWAGPPVTFPVDPRLVGLDLWIQALIVDTTLVPVDSTTAVRLTFR